MKAVREMARSVRWGMGGRTPEPFADGGGEAMKEISLRAEIPGASRTPVGALVPRADLSEILQGAREVDTRLRIRDARYGWRDIDVSVLPGRDDGSSERSRRVMQKIPGHGRVPLRLAFLEDVEIEDVENPAPERRTA